jgi:hypothetical protein
MLEQSVAGYASVAMADADKTLTTANGSTDEARNACLNLTGALTADRNVIVPSVSKAYIVRNSTTGGFAVTVKTAAGTGVAVSAGTSVLVFCDGTNVFTLTTGDVTLGGVQILTNKTTETLTLNKGYTEQVHTLSGTVIDPLNGSIQTLTLTGNIIFTESVADGQSVVLMINPVTHTVTWPTTTWVRADGNTGAPTLKASATNTIVLWQVAGTLYGNWIGAN